MRICHFSDSHLGAGEGHARRADSGLTVRQEDIISSFNEAVEAIIEIKPDVCIHSGDLFHTVRPLNRVMAVAAEQLHRLASENGIPTVVIAGNHDAPKQAHIGAALEVFDHIDNLYVSAGSRLEIFEIDGSKFFALPHCLTTTILKDELSKCQPSDDATFNILIMHGVAAGMPEFSMADLGEQEIPLSVFDKFDYTALGHFHNHTRVAEKAYYAGSTERLSQAERDASKGFLAVELDPFGVRLKPVTCREMISLQTINAAGKRGDEVAAIIQEKVDSVDSSDKMVRLKVEGISEETLKTIPADVISSLKQKSFSLDISFDKEKSEQEVSTFGRTAIGRLDSGFLRFLDSVDLTGFDSERLQQEALKYLAEEN